MNFYISTFIDPNELASTILSTVTGIGIQSNLTSTVTGLGSSGYVSSLSLISTTTGLQRSGFVSSPNLLNLVSTQGLSTVLYSTVNSLATLGYISTSQLTSTVAGVLATSILPPFLSAFTVSTGSLNVSSLTGLTANVSTTAFISSLIVNSLQLGDGTGWVNVGPIQTVALSSIQINTNSLYTNNTYFGLQSSLTALQFYGLQGNFNNTVIAEVSTGVGIQELLMFKGSTVSDRIRMQTTGAIVFEPGVSSRLFNSNTIPTQSNATPAMIINSSSNVGIQTASPGAALDVNGTARAITLSSQQLFVSSINGGPLINSSLIQSTVIGLGSVGYVSTLSLISTTLGLQQSGFVSSPNLLNLVSTPNLLNLVSTQNPLGLVSTTNLLNLVSTQNLLNLVSTPNLLNLVSTQNLLNLVSTPNLLNLVSTPNLLNLVSTPNLLNLVSTQGLSTVLYSTITSLASFGYISSLQLISTTRGTDNQLISTAAGLNLYISSFIDPAELASTVIGLGSAGFISSIGLDARFASTTTGLGSAGYVSTASLVSTTLFFQTAGFISSPNLLNLVSTQGLSTVLYSTITSLASFGYISTSQLTSTTLGLQQSGFISSPNLLNLVSTTFLNTVIASSFTGLGSAGYISTSWLNSTVQGLGSSGYISSLLFVSNISAAAIVASSIGIGCNAPAFTLDILGSAHANSFSSLILLTSSYTGNLGDAQTVILWEV